MKISILTSENQWFEKYASDLAKDINAELYTNYLDVKSSNILFILGFHKILPQEFLKKNKHNIVIHESALPQGKGWAPYFWQILEGEKEIVFSMFEASDSVDNGDIYMQKTLQLNGSELNELLRKKQAKLTLLMCKEFITNYEQYKVPSRQNGEESFYTKRTLKDSKLDINKTIKEQFNLLRIVNNNEYPAFFEIDGTKYILKIEEVKNEDR